MESLKKKHSEILALYKLEQDIRDIYVEGYSDKVFFENYLKNKNYYYKVIPIEVVDLSELPEDYLEGLDINSNRNKVVVLSKLLNDRLPLINVRCVVDKDFDDYLRSISNSKLLKTDFSCLESYLFCEEVIDKFLKIGIGNFPFKTNFILDQLMGVLKSLFCLRLLRELNYRSAKLLKIDAHLLINKQNGTINFEETDYLDKFIKKNNLSSDNDKILSEYYSLFQKLNLEIRHYLHGHDFLEIFFLYVNKVKNTTKYKEENFGRTLFLTVEAQMVENYRLFQNLII